MIHKRLAGAVELLVHRTRSQQHDHGRVGLGAIVQKQAHPVVRLRIAHFVIQNIITTTRNEVFITCAEAPARPGGGAASNTSLCTGLAKSIHGNDWNVAVCVLEQDWECRTACCPLPELVQTKGWRKDQR